MLEIKVPDTELWDYSKEVFVSVAGQTLQLEHTLVTLSEWESKWKVPFLSETKKSADEILDYVKIMTITPNVPEELYYALTSEHYDAINNYISDPMTATWFNKLPEKGRNRQEQVTSELIYYRMIALNIPIDVCQHWHLNRLLTLIEVCNRKNQPPKKMSKSEALRQTAAMNAKRRAQLKSKG